MPIRIRRPAQGLSLEDSLLLAPEVSADPSALVPAPLDEQVPAQQPAPPFLSLREAADWLCVSISTLKRLIANGALSTIRVGARRKIPASALEAYVARDILLPSQVSDILQSKED
jgi:excisionase family DNA binding protein